MKSDTLSAAPYFRPTLSYAAYDILTKFKKSVTQIPLADALQEGVEATDELFDRLAQDLSAVMSGQRWRCRNRCRFHYYLNEASQYYSYNSPNNRKDGLYLQEAPKTFSETFEKFFKDKTNFTSPPPAFPLSPVTYSDGGIINFEMASKESPRKQVTFYVSELSVPTRFMPEIVHRSLRALGSTYFDLQPVIVSGKIMTNKGVKKAYCLLLNLGKQKVVSHCWEDGEKGYHKKWEPESWRGIACMWLTAICSVAAMLLVSPYMIWVAAVLGAAFFCLLCNATWRKAFTKNYYDL